MRLDSIAPLGFQVGYGTLGVTGNLGYESKLVSIQGQTVGSAVSAHPPARILYRLGRGYSTFRTRVALNDDVPAGWSHAHFTVLADGRQVAHEPYVVSGQSPRRMEADVTGSELLELVVTTGRWEWAHAVWIEPELDGQPLVAQPEHLVDCLGRSEMVVPSPRPQARRCVATVASHGFDEMLDDLLGSLNANGGCQDALRVVVSLGDDIACAKVAAKYRATLIPCSPRAKVNPMSKGLLYSLARVVDAEYFICLDADMLVLGDLRPVFGALEAAPEGTVYGCREGNGRGLLNLGHALETVYGGHAGDLTRLLGNTNGESAYPLVVNDGIFAAGRTAMMALDGAIREMPEAAKWVDERPNIWWRNQFVFNLALAKLHCGAELDSAYNVQLHAQDVEAHWEGSRLQASWRGRPVRIIHFSGVGRRKLGPWRHHFRKVADPLVGTGDGDGYAAFLDALRPWVAKHGVRALAWSFYGTTDARDARVRDPGVFPLFAALHYLIRSNGCTRVVESGTARGVSAACIASAVAHRPGARVVTYDPSVLPGRNELWATLPQSIGSVIEFRQADAVAGIAASTAAGERFDAAFLDSIHTEEHVWKEFQVAREAVVEGGLILIHDVRYADGTVEGALQRIEAAGYGVTRLWTGEGCVREDDNLGLAVIENRRRKVDAAE
jgi:predicted O-methyltransferase YrrM